MTLSQIMELCRAHPVPAAILLLLGGTITVKKMELPVWGVCTAWINGWLDGLGKRLNASLAEEIKRQGTELSAMQSIVGQLQETLAAHELIADRRRADDYRRDILRFNRELMAGSAPDRESYVEALTLIDRYCEYCREHPDYPNSRATAAIENIRQHYQQCLLVGF